MECERIFHSGNGNGLIINCKQIVGSLNENRKLLLNLVVRTATKKRKNFFFSTKTRKKVGNKTKMGHSLASLQSLKITFNNKNENIFH